MCELLVFIHDHTANPDPGQRVEDGSEQHAALPKPGDVITAQEDGWNWGTDELTHPWFRIDKYPGKPVGEVEHFLGALPVERHHDLAAITYLQYRAVGVDPQKPGDLTPIPRRRIPIGF